MVYHYKSNSLWSQDSRCVQGRRSSCSWTSGREDQVSVSCDKPLPNCNSRLESKLYPSMHLRGLAGGLVAKSYEYYFIMKWGGDEQNAIIAQAHKLLFLNLSFFNGFYLNLYSNLSKSLKVWLNLQYKKIMSSKS
jgi:hypothetical protein